MVQVLETENYVQQLQFGHSSGKLLEYEEKTEGQHTVPKPPTQQFSHPVISSSLFPVTKTVTVREALKFPSLSFVKPVEVLQISHRGLNYRDDDLGLCVDIPAGAIQQDLYQRLEVAMSLFGPFQFQANTSPIAPILMLCPQEEIALEKPIKITLSHYLDDIVDSDIEALGIKVTKADHRSLFNDLREPLQYLFEDLESEQCEISLQRQDDFQYVTFSISHFCFITIRQETSKESMKGKKYCISPKCPVDTAFKSPLTYYFPIIYYEKAWIKVLEKKLTIAQFIIIVFNAPLIVCVFFAAGTR